MRYFRITFFWDTTGGESTFYFMSHAYLNLQGMLTYIISKLEIGLNLYLHLFKFLDKKHHDANGLLTNLTSCTNIYVTSHRLGHNKCIYVT